MALRREDRLYRVMSPLAIILALMAGLLLLMGGVVRRFQAAEAITGYDPEKVVDKKGLTDWVGGNAMLLGAAALVASLFIVALPAYALPIFILMAIIIILGFLFTAFRSSRFER